MSDSDNWTYDGTSDDECENGHAWVALDDITMACDNCSRGKFYRCPHKRYTFELDGEEGFLEKVCQDCGERQIIHDRACHYHKVIAHLKHPESFAYLEKNYPLAERCSRDQTDKKGRCQNILRILASLTLFDRCHFEIRYSRDEAATTPILEEVDNEIKWWEMENERFVRNFIDKVNNRAEFEALEEEYFNPGAREHFEAMEAEYFRSIEAN